MLHHKSLEDVTLEAVGRLTVVARILSDDQFPDDDAGGYDISVLREIVDAVVEGLQHGLNLERGTAEGGARHAT